MFVVAAVAVATVGPPEDGRTDSVSKETPPDKNRSANNSGADSKHPAFRRLNLPGLPNAIQVNPRLISGGQPSAEEGFQQLRRLNVKTIISVDGITPDLESAKRSGIRYIHLPIGYRGIDQKQAGIFAYCFRNLPGPIYIHCHHGKHRSPAAAAVGGISAGLLTRDHALELLTLAKTDPAYQGLFASVRQAKRLSISEQNESAPNLPQTAPVSDLTETMVNLEDCFTKLESLLTVDRNAFDRKQFEASSILLRDDFAEILRECSADFPDHQFQQSLKSSLSMAEQLRQTLQAEQERSDSADQIRQLKKLVHGIRSECRTCHAVYRDAPVTP